ncbi:hypothetical protein BGZ76_006838 [Entomortierella beljakovae]|nr:hypothetical protein BGZ76_006838 [Entomortierella beljakovae]
MQNQGIYLMYIECTYGNTESATSTLPESTHDKNFIGLYDDLVAVDEKHGLDQPNGRSQARRLILLEYTSRLFFFILLKDKVRDLTPSDYLLSQLNGGQKGISEIKTILKEQTVEDLSSLLTKSIALIQSGMSEGSKFAIAIDEASVASSKMFPNKFINNNGHPRGLLTPMLECIARYSMPVIIAGTAFTLQHGQQVQSDIGKGVSGDYLSDFEVFAIEDVKTYVEGYIDLTDCNHEVIDDWKFLEGRPRLSARLVSEIIMTESKLNPTATMTKQEVLESAVKQTVFAVKQRLMERLSTLADKYLTSVDPCDSIMRKTLEKLFISC